MKMTDDDKKFYIEYLETLLKLNRLHSGHWKEKTIVTPTLISENLCKALLGLEDREKGKSDHDARFNGKKYEIKATSDEKGVTTYNPKSKVDFFVWIFFNYKNEELVIKQTPFSEIQKSNSKNIKRVGVEEIVEINNLIGKKKQCRKSIQLSKVQWNIERVFCMKTLKELKKENNDEKGKI